MLSNLRNTMTKENTQISLAAPQSGPMALLAGADLSTLEVDKMAKIMEMQFAWDNQQSIKAYNVAMSNFQTEMPQVFKKQKGNQYTYAAFEDIMREAKPHLQRNGLSISFSQSESNDSLIVTCRVSHISGHSVETPFTLPKEGPLKRKDGTNITSQAQAQGGANSYAKRYCLCNALNIVVAGEDFDMQATGSEITAAQMKELREALDKTSKVSQMPDLESKLMTVFGITDLESITVDQHMKMIRELRRIYKESQKKDV